MSTTPVAAFPSITSLDAIPSDAPARKSAEGSGGSTRVHRLTPLSKYDAARTGTDNRRHWQQADGLSANAANSPDVRRVLRNRARYEDANNSYASGLTGDRANETIGTGPRLQLTLPDDYKDADFQRQVAVPENAAREVELRWCEWCEAVGLLDKLLVMDESETREGESFGFKFVNPGVANAVQLDLRVYEADQIATPTLTGLNPGEVDGITFDAYGNPSEYHVLKQHPGEIAYIGSLPQEFDRVAARQMIHFFKPRRAGHARGVPAFTPALSHYSTLRRYTDASLLTAEAQARIHAVIESDNRLADCGDDQTDDGGDDGGAGEQIYYGGTHMLTLSAGQKAHTLPATAPSQSYREFKAEILTECGRSINAPRNVSNGSSAEYNYSSGRLDQQQWQRSIKIRRRRVERIILNDLFRSWLEYALLIPGYLPEGLPPFAMWKWQWRWDGFVSIDPLKDSKATTERLANGTSSLDRECGEMGEDWEETQDQRLREELREINRRKALGLPPKMQPMAAGGSTQKPAVESAYTEEDDAE